MKIPCEKIVGNLLRQSNESVKNVISAYDIYVDMDRNEMNLSKFQVLFLDQCADYLQIKTHCEGRKLYNKKNLVRKIVFRIESLKPMDCPECSSMYKLDIKETPLCTCARCCKGSHNCSVIREFRSSLPDTVMRGFVWLCPVCIGKMEFAEEKLVESSETLDPNENLSVGDSNETREVDHMHAETNADTSPGTNTARNGVVGERERLNICYKYKRANCPHGIRGNRLINGRKCQYAHPVSCKRYCSFGFQGNAGCKRGKDCTFYHPVLCKFSVKNRLCLNEDCSYVHLKGTARKENGNNRSLRNDHSMNDNRVMNPIGKKSDANENNYFLKLEKMIEMMRKDYEEQFRSFRMEFGRSSYVDPVQPRYQHQSLPVYPHVQTYAERTMQPAQIKQTGSGKVLAQTGQEDWVNREQSKPILQRPQTRAMPSYRDVGPQYYY